MSEGFYLSLMIGPAVPISVSKDVLDALASVQVMVTAGTSTSGFELTFNIQKNSPLITLFLLSGGSIMPIVRVVIVVTVNGTPDVLMDGVMTEYELSPGTDGGTSTLKIKGKDLTAVMDYIDLSGLPYPAMPAEARITLAVAKYAFLGIVPLVIPSVLIDIPIPLDRIPTHQGTDLQYIKSLADEVGYVFYIDPGPAPGMSIAYWGPEIKVGPPQPPLNVDMDAHTNVESLSFSFDTESKMLPVILIQESISKALIPIPVPDITPLSPPLGLISPIPKDIDWITGTAKLSPIRAAVIGLAKAAKSADAVSASGNLDVLRYGHVLKARKLVSVRGAGNAFDGLYYVKSVTHNIKRGEYKQSFTLSRNGLISTFQKVPV
jgi:hypothetical protein